MATRAQTESKAPASQSFTSVTCGLLQRTCASCDSHTIAGGECAECAKNKSGLQRKLTIGASNDPLEWEADRVAVQVMAAPAYSPVRGTPLRIQRFAGQPTGQMDVVPASVDQALASPGRPLDPALQQDMEQRFGHDFSQVRVHADAKAAESARAVNALAYTVGRDVVFGVGQYMPSSSLGQRLLAHELTHVVQQRGSVSTPTQALLIDPSATQEREARENASLPGNMQESQRSILPALLQRACLKPEECKTAVGQSAKTDAVTTKPENVNKRKQRKQLCQKKPPDPGCTGDGHSARAVELEKLLFNYQPERRSLIHGIFIDKDMPADWKAYHSKCAGFFPPIDGEQSCIFAPEGMEKEAAKFNTSQDATIGGMTREEWQLLNLRILVHETGHARFEAAKPAEPRPGACKFEDIRSELHEIAADMEEFAALYDLLQRRMLTESERDAKLQEILTGRWIPRASDNWKKIRCVCACDDADKYVQKTAAIMTSGWATEFQIRFHSELRKAIPSWPVEPPKPAPRPALERPAPERPKFGPLYRPRTDFIPEMERSVRDL